MTTFTVEKVPPVSDLTTVLTLIIGSLAAFAFARFEFTGKKAVLVLFLLSQMLPGAAVVIPLFQIVQDFGGTIRVGSREGEGAAFFINFPACGG